MPAVSTSTLLAVVAFIAGTYYKARVELFNTGLTAPWRNSDCGYGETKRLSRLTFARATSRSRLLEKWRVIVANRYALLEKRRLEAIEKVRDRKNPHEMPSAR
jgi:hypothetical protein